MLILLAKLGCFGLFLLGMLLLAAILGGTTRPTPRPEAPKLRTPNSARH